MYWPLPDKSGRLPPRASAHGQHHHYGTIVVCADIDIDIASVDVDPLLIGTPRLGCNGTGVGQARSSIHRGWARSWGYWHHHAPPASSARNTGTLEQTGNAKAAGQARQVQEISIKAPGAIDKTRPPTKHNASRPADQSGFTHKLQMQP